MMDPSSKATTTKSVGSSKADATQAFRAMAGNGAKETLEKMSAAAAETTTLMQDSCSTAVKGAQDYSAKVVEFARANTEAAVEFVQKLSSVKSPSEFFELSTNHSRKQFEILTEQTRELTALAQEVALAAVPTVCCAPRTSLDRRDMSDPVCVRVKKAIGMRCTWS